MTEIIIYSKPGCGKCESAKAHCKKMGFSYDEKNLIDFITHHEGWREDGSVDLLAWCNLQGNPMHQLPTIRIDGEYYTMSAAMKRLKAILKGKGD
jgi:glutaredoxin